MGNSNNFLLRLLFVDLSSLIITTTVISQASLGLGPTQQFLRKVPASEVWGLPRKSTGIWK